MGSQSNQKGTLYGIGVGPGDPDLMTLKSVKRLTQCSVWMYLTNSRGESQAYSIAAQSIDVDALSIRHLAVNMPMDKNPDVAANIYREAALRIQSELDSGLNVAFVCEGDPLFFGSFIYLLEQLNGAYPCEVVPGITSPQAAAAAFNLPMVQLKESYVVLTGRHTDQTIADGLAQHDTVVFMKVGRHRQRIFNLIEQSGRTQEAKYGEFIGRENETLYEQISSIPESTLSPYFSLIVVTRPNRERL